LGNSKDGISKKLEIFVKKSWKFFVKKVGNFCKNFIISKKMFSSNFICWNSRKKIKSLMKIFNIKKIALNFISAIPGNTVLIGY
jgi:hypothetical protein